MKKYMIIILVLSPALAFAQTSKVFDDLSMKSEILNMDRKYAVYLPPDYETSKRSYPVLYLLHGGGDDQTGWVQFGEVRYITDQTLENGKSTPMIIVMPDANTGKRGYMNDVTGRWRYEDFFFDEFMPYIEKTYRIKSEKRYRAVAGLSMGGGGTFYYALHRPDLFSAACPLSASIGPTDKERAKRYFKQGEMEGASEQQVEDWLKKYNVLEIINNMPDDKKKAVRWYIDCGDDDFLYEGNSQVHIAMRKNNIPHEFRIRDGSHNWTYWRHSLYDVLNFVSMGFHQGTD
ncbi:MAG: esterase family protein [Sedimentisphaerales bacterium]|nr:esterase family protein [Sedimentisphaerales bacterium]